MMKRLFVVVVSLILFYGCDEENEIERGVPVSYFDNKLYFKLQDSEGNDLLDTLTPGHYKVSDIEMTNRPSSEEPTALVPKTMVYIEVHKQIEGAYYYIELGLIMPQNVGKEEYVEVETSKGKKMAWISETEPTYTNIRIGNEITKTFKAVYKTYVLDAPGMIGGNSTTVQKIWSDDELIFNREENGGTWYVPVITVEGKR